MPYSTGSIDSGYHGMHRHTKRLESRPKTTGGLTVFDYYEASSNSSDLTAMSVTGTDEDDSLYFSTTPGTPSSPPLADTHLLSDFLDVAVQHHRRHIDEKKGATTIIPPSKSGRARARRSKKKLRRGPTQMFDIGSAIGSCCSMPGSSAQMMPNDMGGGRGRRRRPNQNRSRLEDLAFQVYVYFQSLLAVLVQQLEDVEKSDAASTSSSSSSSTHSDGAAYYSLLTTSIREYLMFLERNYALSCRAQNAGTQTPSSSSSSSNDATNNIDWTRVSRTDFATNEDVMRAVQQLAKNANTSAAAAAAAAAATAGAMPMTMPSPQLAAITAAAIAGGYQPQLAYMSQDERNNLELFSRLNGLPSLPYYPHPSLSHNRPGSNGQPHLTSQPPPPVLPPATASTSRHPSSSSMYGGSNNSINTLGVNTSIPPPPTPSSLSSANRVQHPPPIPSKDAPVNVSRSLSGNVNGVPKANEVHHVAPQKECYSAVLQRGNSDAERDRPKVAVKKEEVPLLVLGMMERPEICMLF
ncbi:unnamed protein product [Caenorhabditis auriculariae]|uniref:Uncharacterized protein n=1 Tax=Caenorhabditis auriculariae TaxID=2777116 RepID=A0A8S1GRV1_9PELO|nr:unnamed protein product [Caenorhabditis auriculariae]